MPCLLEKEYAAVRKIKPLCGQKEASRHTKRGSAVLPWRLYLGNAEPVFRKNQAWKFAPRGPFLESTRPILTYWYIYFYKKSGSFTRARAHVPLFIIYSRNPEGVLFSVDNVQKWRSIWWTQWRVCCSNLLSYIQQSTKNNIKKADYDMNDGVTKKS